jgi:hypothetical protein
MDACRNSDNIVRTFWEGGPLSMYEELSLLSFVKHQHEVEIYAYHPLKVPPGVRLCDANEILPKSDLLQCMRAPASWDIPTFSDLFRYALLYQKGGIWVDTDVLCHQSFATIPSRCVGWESEEYAAIGVMKFPEQDPLCGELYRRAKDSTDRQVAWAELGPRLLTKLLKQPHNCHVLPSEAFYPIPWQDAWKLIDPERLDECEALSKSAYCVHWWNNILAEIGVPKSALPPKGSYLFEQAQRILGSPSLHAWPASLAKTWTRNYRNSELLLHPNLDRPITYLMKSNHKMIANDVRLIIDAIKRQFSHLCKNAS